MVEVRKIKLVCVGFKNCVVKIKKVREEVRWG
jgi:hypothetical protein